MKIRAVKLLKAPGSAQRARDLRIKLCRVCGVAVDDKAAARGVRPRRKILRASTFALDVKHKVVRNIRRENQRRALDWQHQRRLLHAVKLLGVDCAQWRQLRGLYGRATT